jgi:hypothetical protein
MRRAPLAVTARPRPFKETFHFAVAVAIRSSVFQLRNDVGVFEGGREQASLPTNAVPVTLCLLAPASLWEEFSARRCSCCCRPPVHEGIHDIETDVHACCRRCCCGVSDESHGERGTRAGMLMFRFVIFVVIDGIIS